MRSAVRGSGMCKTRSSLQVVFIHMSKCTCLIKIDLNALLDTRRTTAVRATIILFWTVVGLLRPRNSYAAHRNRFSFRVWTHGQLRPRRVLLRVKQQ